MKFDQVIHKYKLKSTWMRLELPVGSKILALQVQDGDPTLWIQKPDTLINMESRIFITIPTGLLFDASDKTYIGTYQSNGFVGHIYEES